MSKINLAMIAALTAGPVLANGGPVAVPEIDALAGMAALGVVGAVVSLVWERSRRR